MKTFKLTIITLTSLFIFNSCQHENSKEEYGEASAAAAEYIESDSSEENESSVPMSSTAATYEDGKRKLIRKADISMEVKDVYNSTTSIENKLAGMGGFVMESGLRNKILRKDTYPISSDSAVEVKRYRAVNDMTLRIPFAELGNFLISLGEEMEFLDYRNISIDDVTLDLMMSKLEKDRLNQTNSKLDNLNKEPGKTTDKREVINDTDANVSQINQNIIIKEKLNDEIAFSTVSIRLTEKEKLTETKVINAAGYSNKYHPGFLSQAGTSLMGGLRLFQSLIISLLYIWPLWVIALVSYWGYRTGVFPKRIKSGQVSNSGNLD